MLECTAVAVHWCRIRTDQLMRLPSIRNENIDIKSHSPVYLAATVNWLILTSIIEGNNLVFAFRFRHTTEQVTDAWLALCGENDPYHFSANDIYAITPPQTFTTDLFALGQMQGMH